jgi:putative FmdB family regulatory protein
MPIYAYKCESCGFAKDVLQKMSDDPLEVCPACSQASFKKQLTAAGFQLKGSGWYATDFKGGSAASPSGGETIGAGSEATGSATVEPKAVTADKVSSPKTDSTS